MPDFLMDVRQDWWYIDSYTYPHEGTKVLVGQCVEYPFWWTTEPKLVVATANLSRQGPLEVEVIRQNWYTPDRFLRSDRYLYWRIGVPPGFTEYIVLYTPGKEILGAKSAPYWEENSFQILYTPPKKEE